MNITRYNSFLQGVGFFILALAVSVALALSAAGLRTTSAQPAAPAFHTARLDVEPVEGEPWRFVTWSFDDCGGRYDLDTLAAHGWRLVTDTTAPDGGPAGIFEVTGPACLVGDTTK